MSQIIIRPPVHLIEEFSEIEHNTQLSEALFELAESTGINMPVLEKSEARFNTISRKSDYFLFDHDLAVWSDLSSAIVKSAFGLEYYSKHQNDWGTLSFFSLNHKEERNRTVYDTERVNDITYENVCNEAISVWKRSIPSAVVTLFPDFVEI